MILHETILVGKVQGAMVVPEQCNGWGVIVLAGSSGRIDVARARLFANRGAVAIALRWFGGEGQVPGICEVPIETFMDATDKLVEAGCDKFAYVGTSKGAEAALLTAVHDSRIEAVVAINPSSVVWSNIGAGRDGIAFPQRSSWHTQRDTPAIHPFCIDGTPRRKRRSGVLPGQL